MSKNSVGTVSKASGIGLNTLGMFSNISQALKIDWWVIDFFTVGCQMQGKNEICFSLAQFELVSCWWFWIFRSEVFWMCDYVSNRKAPPGGRRLYGRHDKRVCNYSRCDIWIMLYVLLTCVGENLLPSIHFFFESCYVGSMQLVR